MMPWRNISINAGLLVIGLFLALAAAEIILRIVSPQWSDQWKMYRVDPINIRGLQKNVTNEIVHGHSGEFAFRFSTNNAGLRMGWVPVSPKPPGKKRILMVGDSFTFGYGVEQDQTYSEHLQRLIDPDRSDIEVINAGFASGFTLDTEYLYLLESGIHWDPDVVVVGICLSNDLDDLETTIWNVSRERIISARKNNDWVPVWIKKSGLVNLLSKKIVPEMLHKMRALASGPSGSASSSRSLSTDHSNDKKGYALRPICDLPVQKSAAYPGNSELQEKPPHLQPEARNWSAEEKVAWLVSSWAYHSKMHSYDLVFLLIPDAAEVQWDTSIVQLSMRSDIRTVFEKAARDAGIEIIDPVVDMRNDWCTRGRPLYFNVDGHWNAGGHAFIGNWMYNIFRNRLR